MTLLLAVGTIVLLFTGGANAWYARRDVSPPFRRWLRRPGGTGRLGRPGGQAGPGG